MKIEHVAIVLGQFSIALVIYSVIAAWYVWPRLRTLAWQDALVPLLLLVSFRYLGLIFLLPQVIGAELPVIFALPVAVGDLATGLLALGAAVRLRGRRSGGQALAWLANVLGILDFAYGYSVGIALQIPLGSAYYLPALFNPAMVVAHFLITRLLVQKEAAAGR